jgi:hypothetical protein
MFCRLTALSLVLLLGCSLMTGCAAKTTRTDLLPPETGHPRDYELLQVVPSVSSTLDANSPLYHTLYSRPADQPGGAASKWCSVDAGIGKLRIGRAHGGEYHAGWAYFMPELTGYDNDGHLLSAVPLYACDASGKTVTIIDPAKIPGILMYDFSVSPDGRYVIIYEADSSGAVVSLRLWSVEQQQLAGTAWNVKAGSCWDIPGGNGDWHEVGAGRTATYEFIATAVAAELPCNVQYYSIITFDPSLKGTSKTDYSVPVDIGFQTVTLQMIDPVTGTVAYDDYPHFFEYGDRLFHFDKAGIPTHLFLYDIRTATRTCIDERSACQFLPQWVEADTLTYNIASDPKERPVVPSKAEDPRTYITRSNVSLLADDRSVTLVCSTTGKDGVHEVYQYAVLDLKTMKISRDDGEVATSPTVGTQGWLFFPKTCPWHLYSEQPVGTPKGVVGVAETEIRPSGFSRGNRRYAGDGEGTFTPSRTLLNAVTDQAAILRLFACTPASSANEGIQCAVVRESASSLRYIFLDTDGTVDHQIVFDQAAGTVTMYRGDPSGAPAADSMTGVNNLFVCIATRFPLHGTWQIGDPDPA